jgi:arylsulfatase A-like enzyme
MTYKKLNPYNCMKKKINFPLLILGGLAVPFNSTGQISNSPNILIVYADDLAFGDVQCYNPAHGKIPTPNIDRLASQGMRFTDAHSSSSVCTPSRYTLLTGRYCWRTHLQKHTLTSWDPPLIPTSRLTIAGLAKMHGYNTYAVGKWHLGWDWPIDPEQKSSHFKGFGGEVWAGPKVLEMKTVATDEDRAIWAHTFAQPIKSGPTELGFDYYFGIPDIANYPPYCFVENDHTVGIPSELLNPELVSKTMVSIQGPAVKDWDLEAILPTICDTTISIIEKQAKSQQPFLIYLALTSPHLPLAVTDEWKNKSDLENLYADFVMETDDEVGHVLTALQESGLAENTLVIFTSDNGYEHFIGVKDLEDKGHYPSGPLRGYKRDAWEGGHRIPFIVRYPGVIKPGTVCEQLVNQSDIMATLADLFDYKLTDNEGEDSFSFLKLLKGSNKPIRENSVSTNVLGVMTVRSGSWKLICDEKLQLYNLSDDIGETINLASEKPQMVNKILKLRERLITNGRSTRGVIQNNDVSNKVIRNSLIAK